MDKTVIDILPHQAEFLQSQSTHTGLIGGYGCGKSFGGILKTVVKKLKYPGIPVAYYLPTYGLIKDIAFPRFAEIFDKLGIAYELKSGDHEFHTAFGRVILRSLSNPERIVGYEVGYSCVDETDILPAAQMTDAFSKIIARNRLKLPNGDVNQTDIVGTPEGFKFAYDFLVRNTKGNRSIIKGKTKDNPYLPEGYVDTLTEMYSEQQLAAYLNGEFVNLTSGNVYHRFSRTANHSSRTIKSTDVLHIGMDFNVTKMNAVVYVVDEIETDITVSNFNGVQSITSTIRKKVRIKTAVDEFVNAYDTAEIIALIKQKFPGYKIIIYPDASGDNRKSSGRSDIDLLKSAGFVIRKLSKNPFVKDRVNAMNLSFSDSNGNVYHYVNTDQCPNYTEALEKQTYKNGEPDKTGGFDHVNEAGGYFIYYDSKPTETWGKSTTA